MGERELGGEARRCGVLWGWCSPFTRGRGAPMRGGLGRNDQRYGLNAIDGRAGLRRGGLWRGS
jgi:hypothetical protein